MYLFFWLIVIFLVLGVWAVKVYNNLQNDMQSIRQYLSNLQAGLKKRVDLTKQIVDIAASYGDHEKLTHMTVSNSQGKDELFALAQHYPDLKANQTYQQLMDQLDDVEQIILDRREDYNQVVKNYNAYRNSFPPILIAGKLNFVQAPYFDMEDEDFLDKVKIFQRDDTEALKNAISSSRNAVVTSATSLKNAVVNKVDELSNKSDKSDDENKG